MSPADWQGPPAGIGESQGDLADDPVPVVTRGHRHAVPLNEAAVANLSHSAMALDL